MRKVRVIYWIVLLVPALLAQSALADVASDLNQAEGLYKAGSYLQAEQVCQSILQREPNSAESVYQAAKMLPRIYLATDQLPKAQEAVQQLLAKSAKHPRLPHALHEIIEQAKACGKTLQAGQIYQSILIAQPEHPQAIWLKMGIAIVNAHLGSDQAVDSVLQNVIAEHATDDRCTEAFGQVAWAYRGLGQQDKARRVYQYVVDNWPKRDRTIFSQRGIILCSVALNDEAAAAAGVQKLLADYADSKNLPEIVRSIAAEYYGKSRRDQARPLHQYVVDKCPQSREAIWSQRDIVFCYIDDANEPAAAAALQKLLTGFAGDARLPQALAYVAEHRLQKGNFENAVQLYQHIVDQYPAHEIVSRAKAKLVQVKLLQRDDSTAEAMFQKILTEYANSPKLTEAVRLVGEGYYLRAMARLAQARKEASSEPNRPRATVPLPESAVQDHRKAIEILEMMIRKLPPNPIDTPTAYHVMGESYRQIGQPDKTIECYQQVCNNWPQYAYAWLLQYLIGRTYESLKESGAISPSEADPKIKAAYERLIARYPTCQAAEPTRHRLARYAQTQQGGEK